MTENLLRGAFHFDEACGVSATSLKIFNGTQTTPLSAFTIEMWVKLSSSGSSLCKLTDRIGSYLELSNASNLQLKFYEAGSSLTGTSNPTVYSSGVSVCDGYWHHLAITVAPDRKMNLYVDTRLIQLSPLGALAGLLYDGGTFYVGNNSSSSSRNGTPGYFGQIRLWQSERTLSQIIATAGTSLGLTDDNALSLFWSNEVDVAHNTVKDSSPKGNDGAVVLSSQPPNPWWDNTSPYGALADADHMTAHPINMTGCLALDRFQKQRVECASRSLGLDSTATALTIEFWIQAASSNHSDAVMFSLDLQSSSGDARTFEIYNPGKVSVRWGTHERYSDKASVADGAWHHVAMVWDWQNSNAVTWNLYVDAKVVLTESNAWTPLIGSQPAMVIGGKSGQNSTYHVSGYMAEVRLWQSARTASELLDDASYRLAAPPPQLRLYWPFARDFTAQGLVEDYSAYNSTGEPHNSPSWSNALVYGVFANHMLPPPTPASSSAGGAPASAWTASSASAVSDDGLLDGAAAGFPRVSEAELRQAYAQAQASGFFDKRYFPNIHGIHTDSDHRHAKKAIEHVDVQVFLGYWQMGRRLDLVRRENGHYTYRFVPAPVNSPTARLMLVETYQLSAFLGDVTEGQVVRTFTLMPGETTNFSINTYKDSTTSSESASSIFDSYDEASQASFESALASDQTSTTSEAAELSFYATADVKQRWGTGNADVTAGTTVDGSLSHSNFFQQTSNAIANHAAQASSARNVEVNTSFAVQDETGRQTALSREVRNVNSSRTLDLVFRQLTQQYLTVLHLTDVRVGYYDPNPGSFRLVGLPQLDSLLDQVVLDNSDIKLSVKQAIINQVLALVALGQGTALDDMVKCTSKSSGLPINMADVRAAGVTADQVFAINPRCNTDFWYENQKSVRVSGLAMASTTVQLRTDNVVAEAVIGRGIGLDAFALGLQAQQLQRSRVDTELLQAEADKMRLANDIVANADTAKAALYAQVFAPPRINNNVLYADETGRSSGQTAA